MDGYLVYTFILYCYTQRDGKHQIDYNVVLKFGIPVCGTIYICIVLLLVWLPGSWFIMHI
jgi:hypothetical protein